MFLNANFPIVSVLPLFCVSPQLVMDYCLGSASDIVEGIIILRTKLLTTWTYYALSVRSSMTTVIAMFRVSQCITVYTV